MAEELVSLSVRLDDAVAARIESLASQCGLTRDQMASALVVLYHHQLVPQPKVEETCEGGAPDCGPVKHFDSEGVPLCQRCWDGLTADSAAQEAR